MTKRRVVITGMGVVTPCGIGVEKFWDSMLNGKSGVSLIESIDTEKHTVKIAGEIKDKDFNPEDYMSSKDANRMDRFTQFAMVASDEAIADAGLDEAGIDPYRIGVMVSSAAGGFKTFEKNHMAMIQKGPTKGSPFTVPMLIVDMASGRVSMKHGYKGVNKAVVSACATGSHSIGDAFRTIQYGDADVMVAGGCEATITTLGIGAFTAARTLSKRNDEPEKASRPYDKDRDGFVMGEGAGVLVLEEYELAKKRGAHIYAEIVGYGQSADAYDMVAPDPEGNGAIKSMELALADAGLKPEDIDYINPHGTSTGLGDVAESQAIAKIFGDKDQNKNLVVSSTKSMHGHMLGATGAVEGIVCVKAITDGKVPPTINLDNQDEHVANLDYVPHKARDKKVNAALSNSFGFGGHNATLVFKAV
ncbi:TPA: beta-ketoacyl-[acyl-carrier-protein] synthase II [Candidatus Gastranaerophilales bacterium HUM_3]|jgi:3-oxoacyl-[acyl-carrier-protein] synthase II|nr:MAG: beta-ketoacyl-[acyl-carrier-protein] synthase II [Acinetobacter sp. CAG:196_36_41]DAA81746.1 MAG TPA: beta-ketoacyl-[acyl-carrier-protein] synthase II [Candidatus Gastranaerophilales bacterium HUM_3]DAA88393.1 MAG TPA: beta-ketoacyl-[acyl-carrier-protein] synthase II [Candidatus Gastranaerophilales bacterium HUM_4]DAA90553.1 MAG TPA: beta-ketoacyl-[acyl-carrier-protein] synthase II [Candidatus Gastranaerophilales bacterium HUM_5]DAA96699.1 MAG TPA: beta-ketoacyl-[acyl-carrier-protein] s